MNSILFDKHINRLEADINSRDHSDNPFHVALSKVDARNIASLREGRIPQYRDHGKGLPEIEMFEFNNLK